MKRVVIIVPSSSYRTEEFVTAARTLRAGVVIASDAAQTLAPQMGGSFVRIDLRRPEWSAQRIVALADEGPVDAIVPIDDQGVVVAARAAAMLGLPHNPVAAVAATRDKAELRRCWREAGVPQPDFRVIEAGTNAASIDLAFPVVVKPTSLSASRGVIRADDPGQLAIALDRVRAIAGAAGCSPVDPLLVEEYVPGAEVAVEGLLVSGKLTVLAILDKPDPLEGPYFEETIFVTPSRHPQAVLDEVVHATAAAAAAVGLAEGPIHAEVRIGPQGVRMLELAARSIGGLCGRSLRFGLLGASLETLLLRHALGYPSAVTEPAAPASGVMMIPIPRAGRLEHIGGRRRALAVAGITELEITIPPGEEVVPLPEGARYLGFLFAAGQTPGEVEASLRTAHCELEIVIR